MSINPKPTVAGTKRFEFYVDESGQDTRGELFIVAGVAVKDSDALRERCVSLERTSGKGRAKWGKADRTKRLVYLRTVIAEPTLRDVMLFSYVFRETTNYDNATIQSIAHLMDFLQPTDAQAYVYVDGLPKTKCHEYKTCLRKFGCSVKKVSGLNDENEPLIRLADALAGASRDWLEYEDVELRKLFELAVQRGILVV